MDKNKLMKFILVNIMRGIIALCQSNSVVGEKRNIFASYEQKVQINLNESSPRDIFEGVSSGGVT